MIETTTNTISISSVNQHKHALSLVRYQYTATSSLSKPASLEHGKRAAKSSRGKLQAKVDVASRPDYVGPPVAMAAPKVQNAPGRPALRTTPGGITPVEPPLPAGKLDSDVPGLPSPGEAPLPPLPPQ